MYRKHIINKKWKLNIFKEYVLKQNGSVTKYVQIFAIDLRDYTIQDICFKEIKIELLRMYISAGIQCYCFTVRLKCRESIFLKLLKVTFRMNKIVHVNVEYTLYYLHHLYIFIREKN